MKHYCEGQSYDELLEVITQKDDRIAELEACLGKSAKVLKFFEPFLWQKKERLRRLWEPKKELLEKIAKLLE